MVSKYYHNINYEVARTGKLQQYYTLYRYVSCGVVGMWARDKYRYVKNLSLDLKQALAEAEKIAGKVATVDYVEEPKKEYDEFTAFGLTWKNGKDCYFSYPDNDFWAIWRDNKETLKQMGFWVSKKGEDFMVFCRLDESKDIESLPALKDDYPTIENGRQSLTGKLTSVKFSVSEWYPEGTMRATFELESGYKINGTLPKAISGKDIGKIFTFNGTIEDQGRGFGFYKRPAKVVHV